MIKTLNFIKDVVLYWHRNQAMRLSAALTYYALASLTPLVVLLLALGGLFFTPERTGKFLTGPVAVAIGSENTFFLQNVIENAYNPWDNITAGILSSLVIIVTGSELFRQLGFTLNAFWNTPDAPNELPIVQKILVIIGKHILYRLRAFVLVIGAGILMIGTLTLSAGLDIAERLIGSMVETPYQVYIWGNRAFGLLSAFALFALIYRYIPRFNLPWKAILSGAFIASVLFTVLQHLFSLYLSSASLGSAFGAAGALVVMLFWMYYSMQALFFGAAWAYQLQPPAPRESPPQTDEEG